MKSIHIYALLVLAGSALAETNVSFRMDFPRWAPSFSGGALHDFETDMDGGGAFALDRYYVEGGMGRMWNFDRIVSLSAGYGQDDYRFSSLAVEPWNNIENYRLSLFARWGLDEKWTLFGGPSVRAYRESGARLDDSWTAAFFGGASYRFSERLSLGPGFGVVGQLEDNPSYFPIVVVKWGITDRLSLETGGGLGATGWPGLTMNYEVSRKWKAGLTTRYERKRFRLDGDGPFLDGIGEDRNMPLIGSLTYNIYPRGMVGVIFGVNYLGELSVDSSSGSEIYSRNYDNSVTAGIVSRFRF